MLASSRTFPRRPPKVQDWQKNGDFAQNAKQMYDDCAYEFEALPREDLEDIGVLDRKDREATSALFWRTKNGGSSSVKGRSSRQRKHSNLRPAIQPLALFILRSRLTIDRFS